MTCVHYDNNIETNIQNDQSAGLNKRVTDVKKCLDLYSFREVWLNGKVENRPAFILSLKNRMIGNFREGWHPKISTKNCFSTYQVFKLVHQKEKY